MVVPATLASFDRMLTDGPLTALFAGFLLYCEEQRWTRVWVLALLAARQPLYDSIPHRLDTSDLAPEAVADRILALAAAASTA